MDLGDKIATTVQVNLATALKNIDKDKEYTPVTIQTNLMSPDRDLLNIINQLTKKFDTLGNQINKSITVGTTNGGGINLNMDKTHHLH